MTTINLINKYRYSYVRYVIYTNDGHTLHSYSFSLTDNEFSFICYSKNHLTLVLQNKDIRLTVGVKNWNHMNFNRRLHTVS